ncbi:hypothetical protein [Nitratireductor pacificus]|nr:hypothetical protein [Nitratireductor pacificus]
MVLCIVALWLNGKANDLAPGFSLEDVRIVEGKVKEFRQAKRPARKPRRRIVSGISVPVTVRFVYLQRFPETEFHLSVENYPAPIPVDSNVRFEVLNWPVNEKPVYRSYAVAGLAINGQTYFTAEQAWTASRKRERHQRGYALAVGGLALFWVAFVLRWRREIIRETIDAIRHL